jgi:hypothetical protein
VSGLTVTWSRFYSVVFLGLSDAVKQEFLTVDVHVINMFLCVGHLEKLAADPKVDPAKKEEYLSVASQVIVACLNPILSSIVSELYFRLIIMAWKSWVLC